MRVAACALALALAGCAAVGPDFAGPAAAQPDDWTSWRSADAALRMPVDAGAVPAPQWWRAFGDPVLERLEQRAFEASPDLQTAALRFAQARAQRSAVAAQRGPRLDASGAAGRQRQSEYGASVRMLDALGGAANREALAKVLSQPFTLYQAGFDASWEPDLWGRVRRSIEAADADVDQALHIAQQAFVDRIDQHLHAGMERFGFLDAGILAHAALRGAFCGAAFGIVDLFAIDQRITAAFLGLAVLVHLVTIMLAIRGGLSAAEILARTRGAAPWFGYGGCAVPCRNAGGMNRRTASTMRSAGPGCTTNARGKSDSTRRNTRTHVTKAVLSVSHITWTAARGASPMCWARTSWPTPLRSITALARCT